MNTLRQREELHLLRKLWHAGSGSLLFWLAFFSGIDKGQVAIILAILLLLDLGVECSRFLLPAVNDMVIRVVGPIMRRREMSTFSGTPFYLAGTLIAILIFPPPVAMLAMLYLVWGDPAASLTGILWGHKGPVLGQRRTLVGTGGGILACFLVTIIMLTVSPFYPDSSAGKMLLFSLLGGLIGGSIELLPLTIDDNLTIPVLSGLGLWPLYLLFF